MYTTARRGAAIPTNLFLIGTNKFFIEQTSFSILFVQYQNIFRFTL